DLRLSSFVKTEPPHQFLRQRSTYALTQHRDLREQVHARFKIGFRLALFVDPLVAGAHPEHAIFFIEEQISAGEFGKDIYAGFFTFLAQPNSQTVQRNNVVAMIVKWRRINWRANRAILSEVIKEIFSYFGFKRSALLFEIRDQFGESFRIHYGARKN